MEIYQDQSIGSIYYLLVDYAIKLGCFKEKNKISWIDLDHISSHLGRSQGILNLLRGLYRNALINQCFIPNDLLIKHNCTHEDIIRLCYQIHKSNELNRTISPDQLERNKFKNQLDLFFELATLSKQNLNTAIKIYNQNNLQMKQTNYIFLPIYPINRNLNEIETNEFNVIDPKLSTNRRSTLPIRLWLDSFELFKLK